MATIKRKLRTGISVWQGRRVRAVPTSVLRRDLRTDVLVVGAAVSGALVAEALAADGHSVAARRAAGLETTYFTRSALRKRFGISRSAALLGYGDLEIDPRQLTAGYLRAAQACGAKVYAPLEVTEVVSKARDISAQTKQGPAIHCRHLVFATGYELSDCVPANNHRIFSTYAMATRPQPRRLWPQRCFIWEASTPYLYLRTTVDGRVIIGGEDEPFADEEKRDALLPAKIKALRRKLAKLLPQLDTTPAFQWAGSFGSSDDGLPSIGEIPGMKNCWAVLGYGGNGITYARIASEIIRTALAGGRDPDGDLYQFR